MMKFRVLLLIVFLLLSTSAQASELIKGQVVGIADGDTITVLTARKQQIKIRLYGVDCPESRQAYGSRAKQFTSSRVGGKTVTVSVEDVDRYGRKVGIVTMQDGNTLNAELLRHGLAWLYTAYCKAPLCREWKRLEDSARRQRLGLWADKAPVPPWEFRKVVRNGAGKADSRRVALPATAGYSGNTRSGVFHSSACKYFNCNRCTARFESRAAALQAGYRPCNLCRP